jgi:hypothetical protein
MRCYLPVLFLALCSCNASSTRWVSRNDIQPVPEPNIVRVTLIDNSTIEFNSKLGWYDFERSLIEGTTAHGIQDTIPLSSVQNIEMKEYHSNIFLWILGTLFLLSIGMGIVLYNVFFPPHGGGCLVLIAMIGIGSFCAIVLLV